MAQKYTILKAITRTSNKGFTLLELLIGMIITLIIGGLAMQAFINASATFSKDKKSIESDQNLSAVLQIIGDDIKQSGENINDNNFPTIEFTTNTDSGSMSGSSKITVRRALSEPLTLCGEILANPGTLPTSLIVADSTPATVTGSANCNVGTATTQLLVSRPSTSRAFPVTDAATTVFPQISGKSQLFPSALRKARDYRCQLDEPNPTTPYDDASQAIVDFCGGSALETVPVAVSDTKGHMLIFNQTDEVPDATNPLDTAAANLARKYSITVNTTGIPVAINTRNKAVAYPIGSPIYLFEERVYALDSNNNLTVSVNRGTASTLIKKIAKFNVSARIYSDNITKTVNSAPADPCPAPNTSYTCKYNSSTTTATATDPTYNWKNLAGVKIELQAKYDGTGQNATPTTADTDKLTATAEFFPRNVLSK
jgi:prepilin-type N-terminal cleavage/methylation domain-containing protein